MIHLSDLAAQLSTPQTSLRELIARIGAAPYPFQIVVDESGRPAGTVTDGDVRRALLRDARLDSNAAACMQAQATIGRVGATAENIAKLRRVDGLFAFLPVVDERGILKEVLVDTRDTAGPVGALVMAGGRGRRLGARTTSIPKPLVSIGGKPMIDHIITSLEDAGISKIFVSLHHFADQVQSFLARRAGRATIETVTETDALGTAGSISLIPGAITEPLLVVNADVLTRTDFSALHAFHLRQSYDATIGVARYETQVPFGVIHKNDQGLFVGIDEKPVLSHFIAAGIYYLSPEFCALVRKGVPMDMPELLNAGREIGLRVGLFPIHEYWIDVGRPDDLESADRAFTALPPTPKLQSLP